MKNTTTFRFIAMIAIVFTSVTAFAQAGEFPYDWASYGIQNFKFLRTEAVSNGTYKDVYLYAGKEISTAPFYCKTCEGKNSPAPVINNTNTNITYDAEMEAKKLAFEIKKWESDNYFRQQDLEMKKKNYDLAVKQYKMYKRQGGFKGFTDFLASAGLFLSGTGEVMQGKAALDGLYQDNLTIFNGNNPANPIAPNAPTDWNYGTTPTDWGFGTVTTTPPGQTPPIIVAPPTDWN